jgi:hypothetical protein
MYDVRFEAMRMTKLFFWILTSCRLVGRYQRFGETQCIHFRAEVAGLTTGGIYMGLEEGKAEGGDQPE